MPFAQKIGQPLHGWHCGYLDIFSELILFRQFYLQYLTELLYFVALNRLNYLRDNLYHIQSKRED